MTTRRFRLNLGRAHWRLLLLLAVVVAAVPVVAAANELRVHVDGDTFEVLSFEDTVGDVLDEQGVELAAGDEVLPAASTPLEGVSAITVLRTIDVTLVVDGVASDHRGTWRTVEGLLGELGIDVGAEQVLRPGPRTVLHDEDRVTIASPRRVTIETEGRDGEVAADASRTVETHMTTVGELLDSLGVEVAADQRVRPRRAAELPGDGRITIQTAREVAVVADGESRAATTFAPTVGELLAELGVAVGERDRVEPAADAPVTDGLEVTVRRVTLEEVEEEVAVAFEERTRRTDELFTGERRVAQEGVEGRRVDTYRVRFVDGEVDGRRLLGSEVVLEPVDRVVEVGTKERPAPPPPPPPPPSSSSSSSSGGSGVWYSLAQCESGGRWSYNGSSGYDGGLQFHPDTWRRNKPSGYPEYAYQASPAQQIEVGKIVQSRSGWGAWPSCARKLGLL